MKKILSVVLSVCMMCAFFCIGSMPAKALGGSIGKCTWSLNGTELTISGNGTMGDSVSWPWEDSKITKVVINEGVTDIGLHAFNGCESLVSVTMPSTIKIIKDAAFCGCESLTEITIPEKVVSIGRTAFDGCSQIVDITIPKSVTEIGFGAFILCSSLVNINVDEANPNYSSENGILFNKNKTVLITYPANRLAKSYTIPSSVTEITEFAFEDAWRLEDISIHNNVTRIGIAAFQGTPLLYDEEYDEDGILYLGNHLIKAKDWVSSCAIKEGTRTIGGGAFVHCKYLDSIVIPEGVVGIGENAFSWCKNLEQVSLPKSVKFIGEDVFYDCESLEDVWYGGGVSEKAKINLDKNNSELDKVSWHYNACHNTDAHKWEITSIENATCQTKGKKTKVCSVCTNSIIESIPVLAHKFNEWTQTKAASCTVEGSEERECTKCGHTETRKVKSPGHNYINPTVTLKPTCTESGTETTTCKNCNQQRSAAIKALGHKFGAWTKEKAATCTEGGTQKRTCSVCSETQSRNVGALDHSFADPIVVKEATIYSEGLMESSCSRCDETKSEVIPCLTADGTADNNTDNTVDNTTDKQPSNGWIIWLIVGVAALAAAGTAAALVVRKKKKAKTV